jgi:cytochrome b subunit of formate dehydrogenase
MKDKPVRMSMRTRQNWLIDAAVFMGGVVAALTGIYFLFLPSGGYQGGRNPMYGVTILFERHTWSELHLWGGILMIAAIAIHFVIHWHWVKRMGGRMVSGSRGKGPKLSRGAKINVAINLLIAISFLLCAISGVYFVFGPSGGYEGGRNPNWDPGFLFSRTAWDMIHTWSGVVMSVAAVLHFAIHWRWVKNVTARFFLSLLPQPRAVRTPTAGKTILASGDQV